MSIPDSVDALLKSQKGFHQRFVVVECSFCKKKRSSLNCRFIKYDPNKQDMIFCKCIPEENINFILEKGLDVRGFSRERVLNIMKEYYENGEIIEED